jgi:TP901 family phage tail tape measure protein
MSDRSGADLGSARGRIVVDFDGRGVDQAARALTDFDKRSRAIDQGLDSIARGGAVFGGVLAGGVALAVRSFASFESQMAAVGAVTGATGTELEALNDLALSIGKETTFSASEAAAALEELAKSGVSTEDILNGAAAGATNLAAAAGIGVPQAAVAMANALNIFNLAGSDAEHVADLFAAAANKSATSVDDLAQGLAQSGAVAAQFGVPIEDAVAALSLFADFGLKGSDAGTSFRTMLLSMLDPTEKQAALMDDLGLSFFDAQGNFIGLEETAGLLQRRLAGLTEEERNTALAVIFGADAVRAANVLYRSGAAGVAEYTTAVNDAGAAQRQAEARLDTLAGSFEELTGSIEVAAIEFGENLAPLVRGAAEAITGLVNAFTDLPESAQTAVVAGAALAGALALTAAAGAKAISIGRDTVRAWRGLAEAFGGARKGCDHAAGCLAETGNAADRANRRMGPLLGSLRALAGFAATGIAIVIVGELLEEFGPDLARDIDSAIAGALDAAGLDSTANAIQRNVQAAAAAADVADVAVELGFAIDKESADGIVGDIEEEVQEATDFLPGFLSFLQPDIDKTDDLIKQLGITIEELPHFAEDLGLAPEALLASVAELLPELEALGLTYVEARTQALAAGMATDDWVRAQANVGEAAFENAERLLGGATDATDDFADATDDAADSLAAQAADAIAARTEQEALNAEVARLENAAFQAELAAQGLYGPFTRDAENAREATAEFNTTLAESNQATLDALAGISDIAPELEGVQQGFSAVGASAVEMALDLANADVLDLSASERQALGAVEFLGDVETSIARVTAEIDTNADDLSMWEGRLRLVDSVLGDGTDTLSEYNQALYEGRITQEEYNRAIESGAAHQANANLIQLLNEGRITQGEYNEILEAGIFLRERSAGAIRDEQAAQALLLPELAEYVRLHDAADGAVQDLTDSQKGFLAALQSSEGALALQQLQILAYLAAVGQIPPEVVTEFIASASAADPVVAALFADMGLLEDGVEIPITADDRATPAAEEARRNVEHALTDDPPVVTPEFDAFAFLRGLDDLDGRVTAFVALDGSVVSITVDSEAEAIEFARRNADALDGREVRVNLRTDAGIVRTTLADIEAQADAIQRERVIPLSAQNRAGPDLAALESDLATFDNPRTVAVELDAVDFSGSLDDLDGRVTAFVSLDGSVVSITVATEAEALAFAEANAAALDGREVLVHVQAEDADYRTTLDAIRTTPPPTITIPVVLQRTAEAISGLFGGGEAAPAAATATHTVVVDDAGARATLAAFAEYFGSFDGRTAAVVLDADTADAQAGIDAIGLSLAAIPDRAGFAAAGILANFGGLIGPAGPFGAAAGQNFSGSFAAAIARGSGLAYQAAYTVAMNAYRAILNALQIRSPSQRAEYAAEMVVLGFVGELRRGAGDAARAGAFLGDATATELHAGAQAAGRILAEDGTYVAANFYDHLGEGIRKAAGGGLEIIPGSVFEQWRSYLSRTGDMISYEAFKAGQAVGALADGAADALDVASPSGRAMGIAAEFAAGLVVQLDRERQNVGRAAADLAAAMTAGFGDPTLDLSMRSVLSADRTAPLALSGAAGAVAGGGVSIGSITVPVTVNGSGDPEAVARAIFQQTTDAIAGAISAGVR